MIGTPINAVGDINRRAACIHAIENGARLDDIPLEADHHRSCAIGSSDIDTKRTVGAGAVIGIAGDQARVGVDAEASG